MQISAHSKKLIMDSFHSCAVSEEFSTPLFNYLVHGLEPGGFWSAALANDFMGVMLHSHPSNEIVHLKYAVSWIRYTMPPEAYGSYVQVRIWLCEFTEEDRRGILEKAKLIYTPEEETWMVLKEECV